MPNDPYQIGEDNSGITLVLADRGTSVAVLHKDTHVSGGTDEIRAATISLNGLMTAAHATKLANIAENADVTTAANIATAFNGLSSDTPLDADTLVFRDASASNALKTVTLTNFATYLGGSLVKISGTQSITGTKTFSSVVLTTADINGGTIDNCTIPFSTNTFTGELAVARGGTGLASYSVGSLLYASGSTTLSGLAAVATGNVLLSGGLTTAPAWGKVGLATHVDGTLPIARGGTGASTLGTGVIKSNGTVLSSSAVDLTSAEVTGALPVTKGGTGVATLTAGVVRANGTSAFATGTVSLTSEVSGVLPIANGGTSFSQLSYGQMSSQTVADLIGPLDPTGFEKLVMNTTLGSPSANFTSADNSSTLTYTGTQTRNFLVYASLDIAGDVVGDVFAIRIAKNGSTILATECQATTAGKSGSAYLAKLVTSWIISLSATDTLELFVASPSSSDGTPQRMRLIATPV